MIRFTLLASVFAEEAEVAKLNLKQSSPIAACQGQWADQACDVMEDDCCCGVDYPICLKIGCAEGAVDQNYANCKQEPPVEEAAAAAEDADEAAEEVAENQDDAAQLAVLKKKLEVLTKKLRVQSINKKLKAIDDNDYCETGGYPLPGDITKCKNVLCFGDLDLIGKDVNYLARKMCCNCCCMNGPGIQQPNQNVGTYLLL